MSYAHISIVQIVAGTKTLAPQMNQNYATIVDRVNALSDSINSLDTGGTSTVDLLANVAAREQQIADQLGGTTTGADPNKVLTFISGTPTNLVVGRTAYWYYEFAIDLLYAQPVYRCDAARSTVPSGCGHINMGGTPTNSSGQIKLQQMVGGAGAWADVPGYTWNLLNTGTYDGKLAPINLGGALPSPVTFTAGTLLQAVVVSGSTGAVLPHNITLVLTMTEPARNQ